MHVESMDMIEKNVLEARQRKRRTHATYCEPMFLTAEQTPLRMASSALLLHVSPVDIY